MRLDSGKLIRVTKTNSLRGDPDAITWDETVWCQLGRHLRLGADRMSRRRQPCRRRAAWPWTMVERASLAAVGISGRALVIAAPAIWLTLFFLVPLAVVFGISLADQAVRPAALFATLLTTDGRHRAADAAPVQLHPRCFTDPLNIYVTPILSARSRSPLISTVFALLIGYPMAYAIARAPDRWRNILLMLVILPFWTSFLLRVYALSGFMRGEGVINNVLGVFGIAPLVMMQTDFAVYVGIVYTYLPFMILPLYTNLVKLDGALLEASADLGARPWQHLPLDHPAALDARRHRRLDAGVHPGHRRVRHPLAARRPRHADDRPRPVGRVLRQDQLAARRRRSPSPCWSSS